MISIRKIENDELYTIREIDRSEEIFELYKYDGTDLKLVPHRETVSGFDELELAAIITRQFKLANNGGLVIGAFDGEKIVGATSVEKQKRGTQRNYCKMDILYVSNQYKGRRIGAQLLVACQKAAKEFGADKLYISATPTRNTVDFYIKKGARLVLELDEALFSEEPEDIHLELDI